MFKLNLTFAGWSRAVEKGNMQAVRDWLQQSTQILQKQMSRN